MFAESNPGPAEGAARVHRVLVTQPAKTRLTEDMAAWVSLKQESTHHLPYSRIEVKPSGGLYGRPDKKVNSR